MWLRVYSSLSINEAEITPGYPGGDTAKEAMWKIYNTFVWKLEFSISAFLWGLGPDLRVVRRLVEPHWDHFAVRMVEHRNRRPSFLWVCTVILTSAPTVSCGAHRVIWSGVVNSCLGHRSFSAGRSFSVSLRSHGGCSRLQTREQGRAVAVLSAHTWTGVPSCRPPAFALETEDALCRFLLRFQEYLQENSPRVRGWGRGVEVRRKSR